MGRGALALLLIPSLALGEAPTQAQLEPRLSTMSVPALLEEYEAIEGRRPGLGGAMGISSAGAGVSLLGVLIASMTITRTVNGVQTMERGSSGWVAWTVLGIGLGMIAGGALWLVVNIKRRSTVGEQLDLVQAELDARERQARAPVPPAELLALLAAPTKGTTGGLIVMVSDARGPVAGATVAAGDRLFTSDERGAAVIDGLNPGPLALAVSAPGHVAADEAASVVVGVRTAVRLTLKVEGEGLIARLTGVVRSRETGAPVPAQLEVAETKSRAQVDGDGMFRIDVPGGAYTVRISAAGYLTQTKQVSVKPGDRAIFNVDLHPR